MSYVSLGSHPKETTLHVEAKKMPFLPNKIHYTKAPERAKTKIEPKEFTQCFITVERKTNTEAQRGTSAEFSPTTFPSPRHHPTKRVKHRISPHNPGKQQYNRNTNNRNT